MKTKWGSWIPTQAIATWNREPLFHTASPLDGWQGSKPERHHDFVDVQDFPECWRDLQVTVEAEAKAKEVAVLKLMSESGLGGQRSVR